MSRYLYRKNVPIKKEYSRDDPYLVEEDLTPTKKSRYVERKENIAFRNKQFEGTEKHREFLRRIAAEREQREFEDFKRRGRREDKEVVQERISLRAEERAELETDYINRMRRQERINKAVGVFSGVGNSAQRIRSNFKRLQNAYGRIKTDPFKNVNIMKNFNGGFGSRLDRSIRMPDMKIDSMYTVGNLENLYNDPFKRNRKRGKKKYKKKRRR